MDTPCSPPTVTSASRWLAALELSAALRNSGVASADSNHATSPLYVSPSCATYAMLVNGNGPAISRVIDTAGSVALNALCVSECIAVCVAVLALVAAILIAASSR